MNHSVVVHGASGSQGGAIARVLRQQGWEVTGISRGGGAGTDAVDTTDLDAVVAAHRGAPAAVVQLPLVFDPIVIDRHVDSIVGALTTVGAERIVVNTNAPVPPDEIGVPFVDGRVRLVRQLRETAASVTVVAPAFAYMENLQIPSSRARIAAGELAYPVPSEFAMPWVATGDVALVVASALGDPAPPELQLVAGPEQLRGDEAAAALTHSLARPVRWVPIDHVEYAAMLVPHLGAQAGSGIATHAWD